MKIRVIYRNLIFNLNNENFFDWDLNFLKHSVLVPDGGPRRLRRGSPTARLLGLWVRNPPRGMECFVR
jgi:hypothetical protein